MKKLRLGRLVVACVIAFSLANVAPNTAEAFVNNAANYGNQDSHVQGRAVVTSQIKRNANDSFTTDLQDAVFVIGCGLIGIFLLRMANKR